MDREEALNQMVAAPMGTAHDSGTKVGVCGQAPSDYREFTAFLVEEDIDSMSLSPDSVIEVKRRAAEEEKVWIGVWPDD